MLVQFNVDFTMAGDFLDFAGSWFVSVVGLRTTGILSVDNAKIVKQQRTNC